MSNGHSYPTHYGYGLNRDLDAAWDILDKLTPDAISFEARCFLSGAIYATLMKVRSEGEKALAEEKARYETYRDRGESISRESFEALVQSPLCKALLER